MADQNGQQQGQGQGGSERGFAGMDPDKQRDIAAEGGRSVPDDQRSFSQDRELASEAGRKGGEASGGGQGGQGGQGRSAQGESGQGQGGQGQGNPGNFANDPGRASEAGRKGGEA